jgi:hypothetical protein
MIVRLKQPLESFADIMCKPFQKERYSLEQKRQTNTSNPTLRIMFKNTVMGDHTPVNSNIKGHSVTITTSRTPKAWIGIGITMSSCQNASTNRCSR